MIYMMIYGLYDVFIVYMMIYGLYDELYDGLYNRTGLWMVYVMEYP